MNVHELARLTETPEVHRLIVGDYEGGYVLGVADDPPSFVLRVEPQEVDRFPRKVRIGGVEVPVSVEGGLRPPRPLPRRL